MNREAGGFVNRAVNCTPPRYKAKYGHRSRQQALVICDNTLELRQKFNFLTSLMKTVYRYSTHWFSAILALAKCIQWYLLRDKWHLAWHIMHGHLSHKMWIFWPFLFGHMNMIDPMGSDPLYCKVSLPVLGMLKLIFSTDYCKIIVTMYRQFWKEKFEKLVLYKLVKCFLLGWLPRHMMMMDMWCRYWPYKN